MRAPGQLALAWLLAQGQHIVPIPGTKKRERLAENLGATAVELLEEDLKRLDELTPAESQLPELATPTWRASTPKSRPRDD